MIVNDITSIIDVTQIFHISYRHIIKFTILILYENISNLLNMEVKSKYQNTNKLQMIFFCSSYYLFARLLHGVMKKNWIYCYIELFSNDIDIGRGSVFTPAYKLRIFLFCLIKHYFNINFSNRPLSVQW